MTPTRTTSADSLVANRMTYEGSEKKDDIRMEEKYLKRFANLYGAGCFLSFTTILILFVWAVIRIVTALT